MSSALRLHGEPPPAQVGTAPAPMLAKGFRPFFLAAAMFAALIVPLWLLTFGGHAAVSGAYFGAQLWHAHEMVFGFASAVIAGFLLTAVGNWTGRETAVGAPLLALVLIWLLGRIAVSFPTPLPRGVPALLDLAFLPSLALVLARPLVAAGNRRNYVMLGVLGALWLANVAMHVDALGYTSLTGTGLARRAVLVAVDVVVFVVAVMAGRIFPMFTRNGTGAQNIRNVPALDRAALVALAFVTLFDAAWPESRAAALISAVAAVLSIARALHWGTRHAMRVPLLWILHLGYAFLPLGLLFKAAALSGLVGAAPSLATHALTVGVIGLTTLGMMARVALGHSGRPLAPPRSAVIAFVLVAAAAFVRVFAPLAFRAHYVETVTAAGTMWALGFTLYAIAYAPILMRARIDGKSG